MNKKNYRLYKIVILGLLLCVVSLKDFNSNPKITIEQVLQEEEKNIIEENDFIIVEKIL